LWLGGSQLTALPPEITQLTNLQELALGTSRLTTVLQLSLFDEQNFAEITHPDYPGERLQRLNGQRLSPSCW
jgi:Leucine-rich repeat (LRR) protein